MLYQILLYIGLVGLAAQAFLGFAHAGHGAHAGHHGHTGGTHGGHTGDHGGSSPSHHGQHNGQDHSHSQGHSSEKTVTSPLAPLWALFSPLTIFSLCLGAGVTGMLAQSYLRNTLLVAILALIGGTIFYRALVRPLWSLILNFASKPAESLGGALAKEAEAVTRFDAGGKGLVRVIVDGQIVQLLAHLETDDRENGVTVAPGEKLVVTGIDGAKNSCRVARF
jgi:hypothetical protein